MIVIAFDTECSRDFGTHCEVCSFGFVIADRDLNVEVSKKSYIRASKPTGRQKAVLSTPYEKFKDAPEYVSVHPMISEVFDQTDAVYISHSPETDFRYLCCMDRRFGTEPVRCKCYDILTIVRNYADLPSYSLPGIMRTFGLRYDRKEENSDAKACIDIIRYLCKEERVSVEELFSACGKGAVVDSEVIYHRTLMGFKKQSLNRYYDSKIAGKGRFQGVSFSMAESFDDSKIEIGFHIAHYVTHFGGKLTRKVSESQVFIWDGDICSKRLESANMNRAPIQIISTDTLFSDDFIPSVELKS